MSEQNHNSNNKEISTSGLTAITQLVDITANELFAHNETTSSTHKAFIVSAPYLKEQPYKTYEEYSDEIELIEFSVELQKEKMRELWDNTYDEEWETV